MSTGGGKILIIDEEGFCRICSAILEAVGYGIETLSTAMTSNATLSSRLKKNDIGLIITSYPHSVSLLKEIRKRKIPSFVLSDKVDEELMAELDGLHNSFCMIKPIDYGKFRTMVKQLMDSHQTTKAGYSIV